MIACKRKIKKDKKNRQRLTIPSKILNDINIDGGSVFCYFDCCSKKIIISKFYLIDEEGHRKNPFNILKVNSSKNSFEIQMNQLKVYIGEKEEYIIISKNNLIEIK